MDHEIRFNYSRWNGKHWRILSTWFVHWESHSVCCVENGLQTNKTAHKCSADMFNLAWPELKMKQHSNIGKFLININFSASIGLSEYLEFLGSQHRDLMLSGYCLSWKAVCQYPLTFHFIPNKPILFHFILAAWTTPLQFVTFNLFDLKQISSPTYL